MDNAKKWFRVANIVLLILAMACLVYYDYRRGLWLKGVTFGITTGSMLLVMGNPFIRLDDIGMKVLVCVYVVVISVMLSKALGNMLTKRTLPIRLMFVGAVLFWFSDLMLAFSLFGNGGRFRFPALVKQ